jgi:hypothetical protein
MLSVSSGSRKRVTRNEGKIFLTDATLYPKLGSTDQSIDASMHKGASI